MIEWMAGGEVMAGLACQLGTWDLAGAITKEGHDQAYARGNKETDQLCKRVSFGTVFNLEKICKNDQKEL